MFRMGRNQNPNWQNVNGYENFWPKGDGTGMLDLKCGLAVSVETGHSIEMWQRIKYKLPCNEL